MDEREAGPVVDVLASAFDEIASIGSVPQRGVTRLTASAADGQARAAFAAWMQKAGARMAHDAIGNQFACFDWAGADAPWIFSGSHLDTQPCGGRFDGALGVVTAGCAAIALDAARRSGTFRPFLNLAVVNWTNEEGARYQPSLTGSSVFSGALSVETGLSHRDGNGISLGEALAGIGVDGIHGRVPPRPRAYVELHAEQGKKLIEAGRRIGVVEGTWAARKMTVTWIGRAAHTGPTPMTERHDALLAAARAIAGFEAVIAERWPHLHRSAARLVIEPNSPNVVVERATVWFELRNPSTAELEAAGDAVRAVFAQAARDSGTRLDISADAVRTPAAMDRNLAALARQSARECGFEPLGMASVAGHDAVALQNGGIPSALIFVPSVGGVAHHPDELTEVDDMRAGMTVLEAFLRRLLENTGGAGTPAMDQ